MNQHEEISISSTLTALIQPRPDDGERGQQCGSENDEGEAFHGFISGSGFDFGKVVLEAQREMMPTAMTPSRNQRGATEPAKACIMRFMTRLAMFW
jgi:hypothetical protein